MANNEDKKKALDAAIAKLEKDFGKGTVMKLGDPDTQMNFRLTGSICGRCDYLIICHMLQCYDAGHNLCGACHRPYGFLFFSK